MPQKEAAWCEVRLRQGLVSAISEALSTTSVQKPSVAELALVRVIASSLAHAAAEYVDKHGEDDKEAPLTDVKELLDRIEKEVWVQECADHGIGSVQPPALSHELLAASGAEGAATLPTRFPRFERLMPQNVEHLRGPVEPPRILISVPVSTMPLTVRNPFEASECCRLASNLLTLLTNQQEHITQAAPARFALITHLMTHLLPMPLPIDHPEKKSKCFWMQDMKYETKADIMRNLHLISRHFSAVCLTLRAKRETDGARVVVAAALAAVMDALMRRCLGGQWHGCLISLHYSGEADGPTAAFGLDIGSYREASDTLLLVAPEYQALRTLTLDYFQSIRERIADDHVIFQFDSSMACSEGDRSFIEQVGLCLGVEGARRDAHLLITGERPDLSELFLELFWFRDVVFLWKMLLLPVDAGPELKTWRAADSTLQWRCEREVFVVKGFAGTVLTPHLRKTSSCSSLQSMMTWLGGQYSSEDKAISGASPGVLTGSNVETEDDVLFLHSLPTFNGALGAADSELLLTYLTAPYIRIPLLLGFFTDRDRISLLREPQLQAVLDAVLFEPGPWQSKRDVAKGPPQTVPAADRKHLGTPAGLLFNELLKSPKVVLEAILCMLHVAVEKDTGKPGSANEGLALYLIRLAVRLEAYIVFLIRHAKNGSYLERYGADYEAKVRGLEQFEQSGILKRLEDAHTRLRRELQTSVLRMLLTWVQVATKKRDELLQVACRIHAHLAILYKNIQPSQFSIRDAAIFLSSQIFLNTNHRWFKQKRPTGTPGDVVMDDGLGVCEVELFDMFEAKRSHLAKWLREKGAAANQVLNVVERVVTFRGGLESAVSLDSDLAVRAWVELPNQPGNFVPQTEVPAREWLSVKQGERFRPWLTRVTQGPPEGNAQISVNLGTYGSKRDGLELLPEWAAFSEDYLEAYGQTEAHCSDKEISTKRIWKELAGHSHSVQRWVKDDRSVEEDPHICHMVSERTYDTQKLQSQEVWLAEAFEPVRNALSTLRSLTWRLKKEIPISPDATVWMVGIMSSKSREGRTCQHVKEVWVQRSPF
jgi:hypothetical protein